jgi:hypothetical protein
MRLMMTAPIVKANTAQRKNDKLPSLCLIVFLLLSLIPEIEWARTFRKKIIGYVIFGSHLGGADVNQTALLSILNLVSYKS